MSRQALSNLFNGRTALSVEMAIRFEKAFGIRADTLMRMQTAYDLALPGLMPTTSSSMRLGCSKTPALDALIPLSKTASEWMRTRGTPQKPLACEATI